ncbi:uncharacterized protein BDCG_06384 [Blastomyces dermatitidis ER-3]|uniref:Integral membrane protein n=1 Tax=Ajellomyces dermatitidis (strain ER-3 / ATCC MYA-2586) TaxID=559297 RepID=A0ABP2F335_AJEDR|nr:uncharacterized protein BDCG_06384 [Blastomyces dermatitidis ER-3]EEQ91264.2 hypothetical protein BDCG_06384 [Blastomyces dermatitidis ER-3]
MTRWVANDFIAVLPMSFFIANLFYIMASGLVKISFCLFLLRVVVIGRAYIYTIICGRCDYDHLHNFLLVLQPAHSLAGIRQLATGFGAIASVATIDSRMGQHHSRICCDAQATAGERQDPFPPSPFPRRRINGTGDENFTCSIGTGPKRKTHQNHLQNSSGHRKISSSMLRADVIMSRLSSEEVIWASKGGEGDRPINTSEGIAKDLEMIPTGKIHKVVEFSTSRATKKPDDEPTLIHPQG